MITALAGRVALSSEQFAKDAATGTLPAVSWVFEPHAFSEHPPDVQDRGAQPPVGDVTAGMGWTVDQVNAIVHGGLWAHTAIFIHVGRLGRMVRSRRPAARREMEDGTPFRYGSRVACLVLSPYARSGYISRVRHSHVSLVRFCADTFGLPTLNARDRAADGMTDCSDFTRAPAPPPHP